MMMEKKEKKEITFTEGSVFQALIRFAVPVLGAFYRPLMEQWIFWWLDSLEMLPVFLL